MTRASVMKQPSSVLESPQHASPGQLAWRRLRKNKTAMLAAVVLIALYMFAAFAGFLSPYSPTDDEFRSLFFHPPTELHFRDENGKFHLRPYVLPTHLADSRALKYSAGSSVQIAYRSPEANTNPYMNDTLEQTKPILI